MKTEKWKVLPQNRKYEISTFGQIRKTGTEKILNSHLNNEGYLQFGFMIKGVRQTFRVHQLVMMAHKKYVPDRKSGVVVKFKDGVKTNVAMSNLIVTTHRNNVSGIKHGRTSTYPGVDKLPNNKWRARINVRGKDFHLGCFDTELEAAFAYQKKCEEINEKRFTGEELDFSSVRKYVKRKIEL